MSDRPTMTGFVHYGFKIVRPKKIPYRWMVVFKIPTKYSKFFGKITKQRSLVRHIKHVFHTFGFETCALFWAEFCIFWENVPLFADDYRCYWLSWFTQIQRMKLNDFTKILDVFRSDHTHAQVEYVRRRIRIAIAHFNSLGDTLCIQSIAMMVKTNDFLHQFLFHSHWSWN